MFKTLQKYIRLFSNYRKEPYLQLYGLLGFFPRSIELYQLALKHSSAAVLSKNGKALSNERLEFLGDSVLNTIVSDILYRNFADEREGFLTDTRSKIVKRDSLNQLAQQIGIDNLIVKSPYTDASIAANISGNALEALIGAIYLDWGYDKCHWFVEEKLIRKYVDFNLLLEKELNYKSKLIEFCQKNRLDYVFELKNETVNELGVHNFHTELIIGGHYAFEGNGVSKKESQQIASRNAYNQIIKSKRAFLSVFKTDENTSTLNSPD